MVVHYGMAQWMVDLLSRGQVVSGNTANTADTHTTNTKRQLIPISMPILGNECQMHLDTLNRTLGFEGD